MFRTFIISLSLVSCVNSFAQPISHFYNFNGLLANLKPNRSVPKTNAIQASKTPIIPIKAQLRAIKTSNISIKAQRRIVRTSNHAIPPLVKAPISAQPKQTKPSVASKSAPKTISAQRKQLIALGHSLIGTPYKWGGTTPKGFDCSGFVGYLYNKQGLTLPRTSNDQFNQLKSVDKPAPGDLVFFYDKSGRITHVGMYIGDGKMLHSPQSGETVRVESIEKPNWKRRYAGARRILPYDNKPVMVADNNPSSKSAATQRSTKPNNGHLSQFK